MTKFKNLLIILVGLFFIGGGIALFVRDADYILAGNTVNLNEILENGEEMPKNDYVTYTCWVSIGNYAETQRYLNGFIPLPGKTQQYAILTEADTILSAEISKKETIEMMDTLTEAGYSDDEAVIPVTLTGCLEKNSSDMDNILKEAFADIDLRTEGITLTSYAINTTKTRVSQPLMCLVIVLLGVIMIGVVIKTRR